MHFDPQTFFNFAAHYYALLRDLYDYADGVTEAQVMRLIESHRTAGETSAEGIWSNLIDYKVIETRPGETATWEMTHHVRVFFEYLLRRHHLTTPRVFEARLEEIETLMQQLRDAAASDTPHATQRALTRINRTISDLRMFSENNYVGIADRVMELKSNEEARSVVERFEIINEIWENYLEPLQDLIDTRKSVDRVFDRLDRRLEQVARAYDLHGAVQREVRNARARLHRMRRDVSRHFWEAYHEVLPLYETYQRQSRLYRGASRLLETMSRGGRSALGLTSYFALPVHRNEGLLSDSAIEAYVAGVRGYTAAAPDPLAMPEAPRTQPFLAEAAVLDRMRAELPIDDALAWLTDHYPQHPTRELLKLYGCLLRSPDVTRRFGPPARRYRHRHLRIEALPLRLQPARRHASYVAKLNTLAVLLERTTDERRRTTDKRPKRSSIVHRPSSGPQKYIFGPT